MPFAVPGVIQLTLLDERALLRQIHQLSHDPRYSTVLLMRQGAVTRSTGQDRPPLIPRDPCDTPSAATSKFFPILVFTINVMPFAVPGVIQLTLLDEQALLRQIHQLSHDPRYSMVLLMRQVAVTRSTGQDRPPLIPRDPCDTPSAAASSPQDTSQPRSSQDQDRPNRSLLLPEIPVFPGPAVVDYHCSTLGIPSGGHAQMLDRLLAPAQRQFRPVSLSFFSIIP